MVRLQNPSKKSEINCDATLKSLFGGRDKIGMMEVSKLLSPHFLKN
jgi:upstream activation factor subunit UAF30